MQAARQATGGQSSTGVRLGLAVVGALWLALGLTGCPGPKTPPPGPAPGPSGATAGNPGTTAAGTTAPAIDEVALRKCCTRCHRFPDPSLFPKSLWQDSIRKMYDYIGMKGRRLDGFLAEEVIAWYESKAPDRFDLRPPPGKDADSPLSFRKHSLSPPKAPATPAIAHVRLEPRRVGKGLDAVVCDMRHKFILQVRPDPAAPRFKLVHKGGHPCRTEPVDIDGDGLQDLLVADLGSFNPGDHKQGGVTLLRAESSKSRKPWRLLSGVGRVADVRAADVDGDGDQDVIVGVFGWHETGRLLWLEQRPGAWTPDRIPEFKRHEIDGRHGVLACPTADFDGDGKPDLLVQHAQELETVTLFKNLGGRFEARELDHGPHPAWGSNGLTLVDLDGDGDQDAIISNGDTLDDQWLKTFHGLRWLENDGRGGWTRREIGRLYSVHSPRAADLDGDGDLDIAATAWLPQFSPKEDLKGFDMASLVWFEQTSPGQFRVRVIERNACRHPTLDVGDIDGDGDLDLLVGNFTMAIGDWDRLDEWLQLWENTGRRSDGR